jgi:hypothetical protein
MLSTNVIYITKLSTPECSIKKKSYSTYVYILGFTAILTYQVLIVKLGISSFNCQIGEIKITQLKLESRNCTIIKLGIKTTFKPIFYLYIESQNPIQLLPCIGSDDED